MMAEKLMEVLGYSLLGFVMASVLATGIVAIGYEISSDDAADGGCCLCDVGDHK